ncbi:unnamed protein product [Natator depressus]
MGATSMLGKCTGFLAQTKKVASDVSWTHCSIHRQALVAKRMPERLKKVLDNAVKTVSVIKSWPTNSRIFYILCKEMGSVHNCLLTHTEVRWLSRGKIPVCLFELRMEIQGFFFQQSLFLPCQLYGKSCLAPEPSLFSRHFLED